MRTFGKRHAKPLADQRTVSGHDAAARGARSAAHRGDRAEPDARLSRGPERLPLRDDALIVNLPNDGTIHPSDPSRGLPGGVKFAWWRVARADLVITTRRLDASAASLSADVPSGYGDFGFQPTGLNFPSVGCWEVNGTTGGKTVTFVVNVASR
jgi:hypothetical protein